MCAIRRTMCDSTHEDSEDRYDDNDRSNPTTATAPQQHHGDRFEAYDSGIPIYKDTATSLQEAAQRQRAPLPLHRQVCDHLVVLFAHELRGRKCHDIGFVCIEDWCPTMRKSECWTILRWPPRSSSAQHNLKECRWSWVQATMATISHCSNDDNQLDRSTQQQQ